MDKTKNIMKIMFHNRESAWNIEKHEFVIEFKVIIYYDIIDRKKGEEEER